MPIRSNIPPIDLDRREFVSARHAIEAELHRLFRGPLPSVVARQVSRQVVRAAERRGEISEQMVKQVLADLDKSHWAPLVPKVSRALATASREAVKMTLWSVGVPEETPQTERLAEDWARHRAAEMVGMKYDGRELVEDRQAEMSIAESTRDMLAPIVAGALAAGWSAERISGEVRDAHAFSASRADLIATTEIGMAASIGATLAYNASGIVTGRRWVTKHDDRVEIHCRDNEAAGVVELGKPFPSGHASPPAHPRCRCRIAPVIER